MSDDLVHLALTLDRDEHGQYVAACGVTFDMPTWRAGRSVRLCPVCALPRRRRLHDATMLEGTAETA